MDLFDKIENKSIISHAGNTGNDKCNGITLHFLRYIAERATPFKESESGFKHLIREAIVEFGVRVTRNSKEWDKDVEIIGALKTKKGAGGDQWLCIRIDIDVPVDVSDTFGFVSNTCSKLKNRIVLCVRIVWLRQRDFIGELMLLTKFVRKKILALKLKNLLLIVHLECYVIN